MPELPEVETVRRGLSPVLVGARIARLELRRPDLRFPLPAGLRAALEGQRIAALDRRAKYLLARLESGHVWLAHLGMTGRFLIDREGSDPDGVGRFAHAVGRHPEHDHVLLVTDAGARVTYNDVRRFGFMALLAPGEEAAHPLLAGLGPEPLGGSLTATMLARALAGRQTPIKAALLDQRTIAGLGNIYVCEALFRAGISPRRLAGSLVREDGRPSLRLERLTAAIIAVIAEAIAAGGSTLRDFAHADGSLGYFQHTFQVYGRAGEPCVTPGCGARVQRLVQAGRSTFFCGACQR